MPRPLFSRKDCHFLTNERLNSYFVLVNAAWLSIVFSMEKEFCPLISWRNSIKINMYSDWDTKLKHFQLSIKIGLYMEDPLTSICSICYHSYTQTSKHTHIYFAKHVITSIIMLFMSYLQNGWPPSCFVVCFGNMSTFT